MKTKLTSNGMHLLLIDEEAEIKEKDYLFDELTSHYAGIHQHSGVEYKNKDKPNIIQCISGTTCPINHSSKVIAYYPLTEEAKELDLPILPPFEKEIEEDVNIKAEKYAWRVQNDFSVSIPANELVKSSKRDFIAGYKAAQSKQFSLDDMKKAIEMARDTYWDIDNRGFSSNTEGDWSYKYSEEEIIQSLSTQRLPKEFEPRMYPKYTQYDGFEEDDEIPVMTPMTFTNSEGKQEIQGKYIW